MSEYIDRFEVYNAINDAVESNALSYEGCVNQIMESVAKIPAADVVPVVRCRDCKWWVREGNDSYGYAMFCDHDCSLGGQGIKKPTDYCSYGERKGGDE